MKIILDRKTGEFCFASPTSYTSDRMTAYGKRDRLHLPGRTIWHPGWEAVERYLASLPPGDIQANTINIEGEFLIFYQAAGRTFIFCDRFCLMRVYYQVSSQTIEFFDSILGERQNLRVNSPEAMAFILFRYVPGHRSLFEDIYQLMPGECLVVDLPGGELRTENACVYPKIDLEPASMEETAEKLHALLRESIEAQLSSYPDNEPLLLPLSGGFDSRYLLGILLELVSPSRVISITFGVPGTYDYEIGPMVARTAGVRNILFPLTTDHYNEPALVANALDSQASASFTAETPLEFYGRLAEYGRVVISGHPGGGAFGQVSRSETDRDPRVAALEDSCVEPGDPLSGYLDDQIVTESFYDFRSGWPTVLLQFEHWFFTNHLPKYSIPCVYKLRSQLSYISPFCDYAYSDLAQNTPLDYRLERKLYLYWLKHHFPRLASLPCSWFWGVPFYAHPLRKFAAKQWDRMQLHLFKINHRANKIDWARYQKVLIDQERLTAFAKDVFPPEAIDQIFRPSKYPRNMILYNLKSLEILKSKFGVKFARQP